MTEPSKLAAMGARWSLLSAFPVAGLMTLTCGFPIFMLGLARGFGHLGLAMSGVVMVGIFSVGFIILPVLGALGGLLSSFFIAETSESERQKLTTRIMAVTFAATYLLVLRFWFA